MEDISCQRLSRCKKKNDFFGGMIKWQTRKSKRLTMALTKSMHSFIRKMVNNDYVHQMRKGCNNPVSCQVTQGTLDNIYYGADKGLPGDDCIVQRYAYGSATGKGSIVIDPRNSFIPPYNDDHREIIKMTEDIVGKALNISAASVKIYYDGVKSNNIVKKKRTTNFHSDMVCDQNNNPVPGANSQVANTHVCIWSIGDTKTLTFQKHLKVEKRDPKKPVDPEANTIPVPVKDEAWKYADWIEVPAPGMEIPFDLDHLWLFDLDPQVELWRDIKLSNMPKEGEDTWKNSIEHGEKVCWKHMACKKKTGGWSAALMLRTEMEESTVAVDSATGHVVFDESKMAPHVLKKFQDFDSKFDVGRFEERKKRLVKEVEVSCNTSWGQEQCKCNKNCIVWRCLMTTNENAMEFCAKVKPHVQQERK